MPYTYKDGKGIENDMNAQSLPFYKSINSWLVVSLILAVIGLGISGYLTYTKLQNIDPVCSESAGFDCGAVQSSVYSEVIGIPVQYLGLLGYLSIVGLLIAEIQNTRLAEFAPILLVGITLFGFGFSLYLTYIEAFVLEEWCQWCVVSALVMTALFAVSSVRTYQLIQD